MAAYRIEALLDAGTGTGRMLELLGPRVKRAVGIDVSPEMLAIARDRLTGLNNCQVRLADIYRLPFPQGSALAGFDAVLFHQVLHYLDDPGAAVAEAARIMRPGGQLLIADFAPHELEFLRADYAHRRLGFSDREVQGWFHAAGLKPQASEAIAPHKGSKEKLTVRIWRASAARSRAVRAA
jgi:SAM-dependent methyltransferase